MSKFKGGLKVNHIYEEDSELATCKICISLGKDVVEGLKNKVTPDSASNEVKKYIGNLIKENETISSGLKDRIDSITEKAPFLKGENGMIELDPDNPHHRKWFEEFKK